MKVPCYVNGVLTEREAEVDTFTGFGHRTLLPVARLRPVLLPGEVLMQTLESDIPHIVQGPVLEPTARERWLAGEWTDDWDPDNYSNDDLVPHG
jgi:hypothetical protein